MGNQETDLKKWLYRVGMIFPIFFIVVAAAGVVKSFSSHPIDWITVGNAVAFGLVWFGFWSWEYLLGAIQIGFGEILPTWPLMSL